MYSFVREVKITSTYKINWSYEILTKVAEWLIEKGKLRREDCPIVVTKRAGRRYLINKEPKHKDGGDFKRPKPLSNGLFIETKYSAIDCEDYARRLLKEYSPEGALEVKILKFGAGAKI